jgi:hypothetical protein
MWPMIAAMAASTALGYNQQRQQQKATDKWNKGQAEMTKYSPWTGVRGQTQMNTADPLSGAIQGGLSGFAMGQNFSKMGGAAPAAEKPMGDISMNTTAVDSTQNLDPLQSENQTLFGSLRKQNPFKRNIDTSAIG